MQEKLVEESNDNKGVRLPPLRTWAKHPSPWTKKESRSDFLGRSESLGSCMGFIGTESQFGFSISSGVSSFVGSSSSFPDKENFRAIVFHTGDSIAPDIHIDTLQNSCDAVPEFFSSQNFLAFVLQISRTSSCHPGGACRPKVFP